MVSSDSKKNNLANFFYHYIVVGFALFLLVANYSGALNSVVALYYVLVGFVCITKIWSNWKLLIIYGWILYSNYSIALAYYLSPVNNLFTTYAGTQVGTSGNNIILFFTIGMYLILPKIQLEEEYSLVDNNKHNDAFVICLALALIAIFVLEFRAPTFVGGRGSGTAIYEYSLILFILGFYYSGKSKLILCLYSILAISFALQEFIFGGRIGGIQQILCIFLCLFCNKISVKKTLPFVAIFYIFMILIGQFRGALKLDGNVIKNAILNIWDSKFVLDTAYSACHTSMTFIDVMQHLGMQDRILLFLQWVKSIFLGSIVPNSNLPNFTRQFVIHYYGGLLPFYAVFYLGIPGLILIIIYLKHLLMVVAKSNNHSSGFVKCLSIYLTISVVRWYLYSPSNLFRGVFLFSLAYGGLFFVDCLLHPSQKIIK